MLRFISAIAILMQFFGISIQALNRNTQIGAKIVESETYPADALHMNEWAAETKWKDREFKESMQHITNLWDMGYNDPKYDLLASCNYHGLSEYDKCIESGLSAFEKLGWKIDDEIPELYTDFLWCDTFWCMGGSYLATKQYEKAIPLFEKFLENESCWNNNTVISYEEKLILLYHMEWCYRKVGNHNKADQIIHTVKNSDEYSFAVYYWQLTGTTAIGDDDAMLFYEYCMNH